MTFEQLNLKNNPFREITPSSTNPNLVWAGMQDLKGKLDKAYKDCVKNRDKQIILNWGPWGGGKTFSSYFFQNQNFSTAEVRVQQLYLRSPKNSAKATDEFFVGIIDSLGFNNLKNQIKSLIEIFGEDELIDFIAKKIKSEEFAKAIVMIGTAEDESAELIQRYVYSGVTKNELKKLGLSRVIDTDTDSIKFLSGILYCFVGDGTTFNGRVVLWIDEMEDLLYYPQKNYVAFSQILRDLFDTVNEGFLVFMNFTFAESEEKTIQTLLGAALWSRILKKIRYKELDATLSKEYITDLLKSSIVNEAQGLKITSPAIDSFISLIPTNLLTPREINKRMTSLLNYTLENENALIDQDCLNQWSTIYAEEND